MSRPVQLREMSAGLDNPPDKQSRGVRVVPATATNPSG